MSIKTSQTPPPLQSLLTVVFSLVLASVINVYPLSVSTAKWRPMALMMILTFWLIYRPRHMGVGVAFMIGLIADLLLDTRLGQQAFSAVVMVLVIRIIASYLRQIDLSIAWLVATVALLSYQLCLWLLQYITQDIFIAQSLFSLLVSIVTWPIVYLALIRFVR